MDKKHHSKYVSPQDVIHKCFLTYYDIFHNMPFDWYTQNVHDSCARKGVIIPKLLVEVTIRHFLKNYDREFCDSCSQEIREKK